MEILDSTIETMMNTANRLSDVTLKIGEVTIVLAQKRVTLEEKMLRRYLHKLAEAAASAIATLHTFTKDGAKGNSETFAELSTVAEETQTAIAELHKVVHYNLNFLEQYFEHDFYDKLVNEHKFVDRLNQACEKLRA